MILMDVNNGDLQNLEVMFPAGRDANYKLCIRHSWGQGERYLEEIMLRVDDFIVMMVDGVSAVKEVMSGVVTVQQMVIDVVLIFPGLAEWNDNGDGLGDGGVGRFSNFSKLSCFLGLTDAVV